VIDPIQSAENADMPRSTSKTIDLTPEQREVLFGHTECEPGQEYTVTLRTGDMGDSGSQSFEVVSEEPEDEEDVEAATDESAVLGYDRSKLMGKKEAPKISARDLEYD
jgi:hypothetical protein